jgi:rhodanese-related sulfurtransferase
MAELPLATVSQISVEGLSHRLQGSGWNVLDVRREPEWEAGHIEGAIWWPLDHFKVAPPEIDRDATICCALQKRISQHNRMQFPAACRF